jgi:hypothetical protein
LIASGRVPKIDRTVSMGLHPKQRGFAPQIRPIPRGRYIPPDRRAP